MKVKAVTKSNIAKISRELSTIDERLGQVVGLYGTPPLWDRPPGFETLLQIILEQQVSLASAKACYDKLCIRLGKVTPKKLLMLSDAELKRVGFSRQKTAYARYLSESLVNKTVDLNDFGDKTDLEVKAELMRLKGVGEWTSDIYLLMALLRPDVMPKGDIALHTAWHKLSGEPRPAADEFLNIAEKWRPYRSVAARLLWHFYLSERRLPKPARQ